MLQPPHGTRARYQAGCRCTPCRAAEATYRAGLRQRHLKHLPILGATCTASEAWARIRVLKQEGFQARQVTHWKDGHWPLRRLTPQTRIRLATLIRLRRVCQAYLIQDADLPTHTADDSPPSP